MREGREEITEKIKADGVGAAVKWMTVAGSAMAGNAKAKAECARLLGREVANMGDYWDIMSACRKLMTVGELTKIAGETQQSLAYGKSAAGDADSYLANRLGQIRRERGMTQQQLATKAGVGISTLQKYENGTNRIRGAQVEIVHKIAKALGITVEQLIDK